MPNPHNEPSKKRTPEPERPDYVVGSRAEQVAYYVIMAVMMIVLLVVLVFAFTA